MDYEHIATSARETQKAIKALNVRRTPSGTPKPTPEQVIEETRLKNEWFSSVATAMSSRRDEMDRAHKDAMEAAALLFESIARKVL